MLQQNDIAAMTRQDYPSKVATNEVIRSIGAIFSERYNGTKGRPNVRAKCAPDTAVGLGKNAQASPRSGDQHPLPSSK